MLKDPRTCRIFFSSPFSGMEGEREELTRKYLPQIQHLCNSKGIQFVAVDMRWGITTEMTASAQVIRICLRELDRSDLFVGFYGQRYGWHGADDAALQENFDNAVDIYPWLDNVRDRSVTEVEFLHGHLNNVGEIPAVICFRSKDYDDYMVEEGKKKGDKKQVYKYTAESEHSINMMNDLKQRVLQTEQQSLGVLMDYETPTKGAEFMFNAIWKHLNEVLLVDNKDVKKSKHLIIQEQHDAFLKNRSSMYIGGEEYVTELMKNLDQDTPSSYLVMGDPGSGKSAMLCTWISRIQQNTNYQHIAMVYHFVGYAEDSVDPRLILQRLCDEFGYQVDVIEGKDSKKQNTENKQGETTSKDEDSIQHFLRRLLTLIEKLISFGKLPVIVIDGVDKIVRKTKTEKPLYWLPSDISSKAVVILSTKSEDQESINELQTERKFKVIEILPMDANTKEEFIVKTLLASGKELASSQLQKLVQAEHTDNPLYLKITLNEMMVFGYFRLLDKKIDSLISSNKVDELFHKVLQRLEDDYNVKEYSENLVEQVMCCIYLSHRGITETELREVFNIPSSLWSPLYFAIEKYIIDQAGLIQFGFTELRECVRERYLMDDSKRKHYLKKLIDYFEEARKQFPPAMRFSSSVGRVTYELPWLWLQYGDKMALADTLADVQINDILCHDCMYVLLDLWKATGLSWEEIANKILQSFEMKTVDLYLYYQDHGLLHLQSPGLFLKDYYFNIMVMFDKVGHFKPQEKIILRYIKLLKENEASGFLKDSRVINAAEYRLACLYTDYGNYEKSYRLHREILEKRKKLCEEKDSDSEGNTDIEDLGASYHGLGVTCLHDEDYDKAEEYFLQSMEIEKPLNDISLDKTLYMNLGNVYLHKGENEKALENVLKYLKIVEELNYGHLPPEVGEAMSNIGLCYRRLGQLDNAEKYYYRSLEIKQKSVGSDNILCTVTLVNLSVLEQQRGNTDKAIEYIDEALRIFKLAEVLEYSREYLQAKENKILFLVNTEQWEKAIEEFLPFFEIVVKYDKLKNTLPSLHTDIVKYMIRTNQMLDEAVNVTLSLIKGGVGSPFNYIHLDMLDIMMSEKDKRPRRSEEFSLEYAHKLWPEDGNIVRQLIKFHLIPSCDTQGVIDMMAEFDKVSELGVEIYNATNVWLSEEEKVDDEMLIGVNEAALAKYPDTPYTVNFMRNIANGLVRLGQRDKALKYFLKILAEEPDDAGTILVTAQSAFLTNDIEMGKKYCHIAMEKFAGQDAAAKAKMLLDMVEEGMN